MTDSWESLSASKITAALGFFGSVISATEIFDIAIFISLFNQPVSCLTWHLSVLFQPLPDLVFLFFDIEQNKRLAR
jgi:predicted metalloenzyme YecM